MIMSAIYLMIMYYRDVSGTEQARVRQTQESRFLLSVFSSEIKNAGAVMTLVNTGGFLSVPPVFQRHLPAEQHRLSRRRDRGQRRSQRRQQAGHRRRHAVRRHRCMLNNTIATPAWAIGDQGILIGPDGFYVFVGRQRQRQLHRPWRPLPSIIRGC